MVWGIAQDRLVAKEVALGVIREYEQPQDHIGLTIAPFVDVQSDDVIFEYARGLVAGLAPARAEDSESEMAGKDESTAFGRASLIDWALKDHYNPSDVTRYREGMLIGQQLGSTNFPLTISSMTEEWQNKLARDTVRRRRMLDNRIEWLIMTALYTGGLTYNDGKIYFTVDYGRPAAQSAMTPAGGLWSLTTADPISDITTIQQTAADTYGVDITQAIISKYTFRSLRNNTKFASLFSGQNPNYTVQGWNDQQAADFIEAQTGVTFRIYDSVYRTRALGTNTVVNTRFVPKHKVIFLPSDASVAETDDAIGFARTMTSPHAEGNFASGYYEWERATVDPWSYDIGTGIKAFPVFPHMDKTFVLDAIAP